MLKVRCTRIVAALFQKPNMANASNNNFLYGTDLSGDTTASGLTWGYTCKQAPMTTTETSGKYVGLQPIGAQ